MIDFLKRGVKNGNMSDIFRMTKCRSVTHNKFISEPTGNELFIISMRYFIVIVESLGKSSFPVECMHVVVARVIYNFSLLFFNYTSFGSRLLVRLAPHYDLWKYLTFFSLLILVLH